jgi:hypothetical protein
MSDDLSSTEKEICSLPHKIDTSQWLPQWSSKFNRIYWWTGTHKEWLNPNCKIKTPESLTYEQRGKLLNYILKGCTYKVRNVMCDEVALYSMTPYWATEKIIKSVRYLLGIESSLATNMTYPPKTLAGCGIVDVCASIGGDTMSFLAHGAHVLSCELDPVRFAYLVYNVRQLDYQVNRNCRFKYGNCLDLTRDDVKGYNMIFFDPPWGGEDYKPDGSSIALDDHESILAPRKVLKIEGLEPNPKSGLLEIESLEPISKQELLEIEDLEPTPKQEFPKSKATSQISDAINYFLTEMKIPILMKLPIGTDLKKLQLEDKTKFAHKIAKKFMIVGINF